jgi:hypothetical protein
MRNRTADTRRWCGADTCLKACFAAVFLLLPIESALAQPTKRVEIGVQGTVLHLAPNDTTSPGCGGRAAFYLTERLAFENEVNFFPTARYDVPRGGRKLQLLVGPKLRLGLGDEVVTAFVKARAGFIRFSEGRQAGGGCVLVYPPPEGCYRAASMAAIDLGGGLEARLAARSVLRIDVGDLIIRQPRNGFLLGGPGIRHNLQVTAGVSWRLGRHENGRGLP